MDSTLDMQAKLFDWAKTIPECASLVALSTPLLTASARRANEDLGYQPYGTPEILLPVKSESYSSLMISFRTKGASVTELQSKTINVFRAAGNKIAVCYSLLEAKIEICSYLGIEFKEDLFEGSAIARDTANNRKKADQIRELHNIIAKAEKDMSLIIKDIVAEHKKPEVLLKSGSFRVVVSDTRHVGYLPRSKHRFIYKVKKEEK